MNVNFPTPPAAAALRAEQATSSAAANPQPSESTSFETTLTRSRRDLRSREESRLESRDVSRQEKPAGAKLEKKENRDESSEEAQVVEGSTKPPGDVQGSAKAEPVEATEDVAKAEHPQSTEDVVAQDDEDVALDICCEAVTAEALAATVAIAVAEQVSAASNESVLTVEAAGNQPAAAVAAKAPPPKQEAGPRIAPRDAGARAPAEAEVETGIQTSVPTNEANPAAQQQNGGAADSGESRTTEKPKSTAAEAASGTAGLSSVAASQPDSTLNATVAPQTPPPSNNVGGGEAVSALFAQQPQTDDSAVRDDANVSRVVRGLNTAINQRGGSVTLRLTPPELGAVRIDMSIRDGVVSAKFTAQSESVRNLLTDQMSHLRQALDRQGLVLDKIEVQATPQQSASGGFDRQMDDAGREGRSAGQYTPQRRDEGGSGQRLPWQRSDGEVDTFDRALVDAAR